MPLHGQVAKLNANLVGLNSSRSLKAARDAAELQTIEQRRQALNQQAEQQRQANRQKHKELQEYLSKQIQLKQQRKQDELLQVRQSCCMQLC